MAGELYTAVDFGADAVKVVSLRYRKDRVEVVGAAMATLSDVERANEDRDAVLSGILSRLIRKHSIPMGHTVVGLSGRGTMLRYIRVPVVPHWKLSLLMGFEVEEQMGSGGGAENVAFDFRILNLPDHEEGQFPVLLALAQVQVVQERMALYERTRRRADDLDLLALGAFNAYRWSAQCSSEETTVLLDIGASETHVVLQRDMELYYARTLSTGGNQFTQRIQKALGLLGPEAEDYKQTRARVVPPNAEDDSLRLVDEEGTASDACYAEARALAIAVTSSLRHFSSTYNLETIKPDRICITGGGSRLQGLPEALAACLRAPVERLDFSDLVVPVGRSAESALAGDGVQQFAAAIGMAMGRARGGFSLSMLPPSVRDRRDFWQRRVFVGYAAALAVALLVMVGLGGCPGYGGGWRNAAYHAERAERWEEHLTAADRAHKKIDELDLENQRYASQVEALETRGQSGLDLARSLVHVAARSPRNVFYTGLSTAEIEFETAEAEAEERDGGEDATGTFQTNRFVDLRGILVDIEREQEAGERLIELRDALADGPVFTEVSIERSEILPPGSEEVRQAFALRIGESEEDVRTRQVKPGTGLAAKFILRCKIR